MEHTKTEPFIVGEIDDSPDEAVARMNWRPIPRRFGVRSESCRAVGKAGTYMISKARGGSCKAYPVAS